MAIITVALVVGIEQDGDSFHSTGMKNTLSTKISILPLLIFAFIVTGAVRAF